MKAGEILAGKYRVDRVLGEGGMGVVVAATHLELEEIVAIKVLHPQAAQNADAVARFLREGRATARIKSEHIIRVRDVGRGEDGRPFLVMISTVGFIVGAVGLAGGVVLWLTAPKSGARAGVAITPSGASFGGTF